MKIIEGLKELKLIIKKIQAHQDGISKLNCLLSNEKPLVGNSDKDQAKEVQSLIQSIFDLEKDYIELKCRIEKTNNATSVIIGGVTRTITEWLTVLRTTYSVVKRTAECLNTSRASKLLQQSATKEGLEIIACYDYQKTTELFGKYRDTTERISGTLEVINATTDIV